MDKLKLSIDESRIEIETAACENAKNLAQRLYGALKETGCEPGTVQELRQIISLPDLTDYIKNRIISRQKAEQPLEVLGMQVNTGKLKELIEVPNVSLIVSLADSFDYDTLAAFRYLTLSQGMFSLEPDYRKDITERNTVYAMGKRQVEAARKLIAMRDALNDWNDYRGVTSNQHINDIPGLIPGSKPGRYDLDIGYITGLI